MNIIDITASASSISNLWYLSCRDVGGMYIARAICT